jgi:hypothetical protein
VFDFICLLNLYADPDTVDARLDEDSLIFIPGNRQGIE